MGRLQTNVRDGVLLISYIVNKSQQLLADLLVIGLRQFPSENLDDLVE